MRASAGRCSRLPTGIWQSPARSNAVERSARDEGTRRVGRDEALPGGDPGRCVAPRRTGHPVLEIVRGQRDVARRARSTARRVDPHDLCSGAAQRWSPNGLSDVVRRLRSSRSLGERHGGRAPRDRRPRAHPRCPPRSASCDRTPSARRGRRSARDSSRRRSRAVRPTRTRLDIGCQHHPSSASAWRTYATEPSASPAIRNPTGFSRSSARCASSPAVRASSGIGLDRHRWRSRGRAARPRSASRRSSSAASPTQPATASRNQPREAACARPLTARASASSRMRSARGSSGR